MWLLRILVFVALLVVLVLVGLKNNAPTTVVLFGWQAVDVPLYLVLFGAAVFGLVLGLIFAGIREIQWRLVLSRQRRESIDTERELQGLRTASLDAPGAPGKRGGGADDRD